MRCDDPCGPDRRGLWCQYSEGRCRLGYVADLSASAPRGRCLLLQWRLTFARELVKSRLGGAAYTSGETIDHVAFLREFDVPFADLPSGIVGMADFESLLLISATKRPSPRSTRSAIFRGFHKLWATGSRITFLRFWFRITRGRSCRSAERYGAILKPASTGFTSSWPTSSVAGGASRRKCDWVTHILISFCVRASWWY